MKNLALRDHLTLYGTSYFAGAIVLAILIGIVLVGIRATGKNDQIAHWPMAQAKILQSEFTTTISQDYDGSKGYITAKLLLRCTTPEKSWTVQYLHTWPASAASQCKQLLAEGREIEVRYSPADPNLISLYPQL